MLTKNPLHILVTALLCFLVLAGSLMQSSRTPEGYDEAFTTNIARTERIGDIWMALERGTDLNPPLYYLAVRAMDRALGKTRLALRLPSVLGYVLMSVCLYYFVVRWYSAPYAWLAMLFPLVTQASSYAFDGRPYGLLLGFSALALVCWQAATEGEARPLAIFGLWLSLAAAVSAHYYAVLIVLPLAAGEATRTWTRKRVDLAVWAALLLGLLPLLAFGPLLAAGRKYSATFWAKPNWRNTPLFYSFLLADSAPALVALLLVLVLANRASWPALADMPGDGNGRELPLHGLAAAIGFAVMPALAMALAIVARLGFTNRYALTSVIGLSALVAVAAHQALRGRGAPAIVLAITLYAWYDFDHYGPIRTSLGRGPAPTVSNLPDARVLDLAAEFDLPVVVPNAHHYLQSVEALPAELGSRLIYVSAEDDTVTLGLRALSRLRPIEVHTLASLIEKNKRFFVYQTHDDKVGNWLTLRLVEDGASVTVRMQDAKSRLFQVERRGHSE
jgi:hypothetical protein